MRKPIMVQITTANQQMATELTCSAGTVYVSRNTAHSKANTPYMSEAMPTCFALVSFPVRKKSHGLCISITRDRMIKVNMIILAIS